MECEVPQNDTVEKKYSDEGYLGNQFCFLADEVHLVPNIQ